MPNLEHPDDRAAVDPNLNVSPLVTNDAVAAEWTDYNGHMNVAYYVLLFDRATDAMLDQIELGEAYRASTGCSVFVAEAHVTYERELTAHAAVEILSWITATDDRKRFVIYHEMRQPGSDALAATNEVLCVHVDLGTRRSALLPDPARAQLRANAATTTDRDRASRLGRAIRLGKSVPA